MTRLHTLALAGAVLLLGSTAGAALARPMAAGNLAPQSRPLQVAHTYFAVLNAGMRSGDFSSLASVYAANARLTLYRYLARDIDPEKTGEAHGLAAITAMYRKLRAAFPGYQWTQLQVSRVSSAPVVSYCYSSLSVRICTAAASRVSTARVVSYERVRSPGGSIAESETVFVIKAGKITHLAWTLDFGPQK